VQGARVSVFNFCLWKPPLLKTTTVQNKFHKLHFARAGQDYMKKASLATAKSSEGTATRIVTDEMKESVAYKYAEQHIDELHDPVNGCFEFSHKMTLDGL